MKLITTAVSTQQDHCWVSYTADDILRASGVPMNFVRGGGSTNSVEDRENGDLGAVAPSQGLWGQ